MTPADIHSLLLALHNIARALGALASCVGFFAFWFMLMVLFKRIR